MLIESPPSAMLVTAATVPYAGDSWSPAAACGFAELSLAGSAAASTALAVPPTAAASTALTMASPAGVPRLAPSGTVGRAASRPSVPSSAGGSMLSGASAGTVMIFSPLAYVVWLLRASEMSSVSTLRSRLKSYGLFNAGGFTYVVWLLRVALTSSTVIFASPAWLPTSPGALPK